MATTGAPAPEQQAANAPLTVEQAAMRLEISKFNLEKLKYEDSVTAKGHFPIFPPNHPQNVMWSFAEGVLGAKYITEHARDNVNSIFFLLNTANDLGVAWTFALRVIGMTPRGQVVIPGNLMLAILYNKGFKVKVLRSTEAVGEYEIERPDGSMKWSCPITWELAHASGWPYGKDGLKEPWKDKANMLRWRSLAFTARVVAADALGGLSYIIEEMDDSGSSGPIIDINAEADKAAEANPALKLEPKAIDAPSTSNVIEIPTKQSAKQPEPVLSPQEAKNEAFLKEQQTKAEAPKRQRAKTTPAPEPEQPKKTAEEIKAMAEANASEHGITDDDIPAANDDQPEVKIPPTPPEVDEKAAIATRFDAICNTVGGSRNTVTRFCQSYLGTKDFSDLARLRTALDALEGAVKVLPTLPEEDYIHQKTIYLENPEQFAKNVIIAMSRPEPAPVSPDNPLSDALPEKWSEETCAAAYAAMQKRNMSKDRFVAVLGTRDITKLPEVDAAAFFAMYYHAPDASILAKLCAEKKYPLSKALSEIVEGRELKGQLTHATLAADATKAIMNALTEVSGMETLA